MGIKFSHLDERKRIIIEYLLEQGVAPGRIARHVGVSPSTISRERGRGWQATLGCYSAEHGQFVYGRGRREAGLARRKLGTQLSAPGWQPVCAALRAGWSPEQFCGRMRMLDALLAFGRARPRLCHETIYKAIFNLPKSQARHELTQLLRQSPGGRRRRRRDRSSRFTGIQNITPIEQRPAHIELRLQPGHWEGDLLKGAYGRSCIATLVERSSRLTLLLALPDASSGALHDALIGRLGQLHPQMRRSLTYDRGTEMARHLSVSEQLSMPVYFCAPYRPWQRGTNENTNGLLRQYLPKGFDLSTLTVQQLAHIECALNSRPRRILGYKTPQEVFDAFMLELQDDSQHAFT